MKKFVVSVLLGLGLSILSTAQSQAASPTIKAQVLSFECGLTSVSEISFGDYVHEYKPIESYCKLKIKIANISKKYQTISSSQIVLIDSDKNEYSYDIGPSDDRLWHAKLNPKMSIAGIIYFDVPQDLKPTIIRVTPDYYGGIPVNIKLR